MGSCTVWGSEIGAMVGNMLLLKNPQFLPNNYETLSKLSTIELVFLTKSRNNWVKFVDFLLKAYFYQSVNFASSYTVWVSNRYYRVIKKSFMHYCIIVKKLKVNIFWKYYFFQQVILHKISLLHFKWITLYCLKSNQQVVEKSFQESI